jgi:biotin carboxyl carrier protein
VSRTILQAAGAEAPVEITIARADARHENVWHVTVGQTRADVEVLRIDEAGGVLRINGRSVAFDAARSEGTIEVWLAGRRYSFALVERTARRAGGAEVHRLETDITAGMPGTILKINVAPDDSFAAHAPLIVMESMKMEMTLSAPVPGRVREVLCRVGELVQMGELLMRIDPAELIANGESDRRRLSHRSSEQDRI